MEALVIAGLVSGAIYAISALGIVLTFVSSRIFNFAHGVIALFVAWCYYTFNTGFGWPVPVAAVIAIGLAAPGIGLLLWALVFRGLARAEMSVRLAATIGLSVVFPPAILLIFGLHEVYTPRGLFGPSPHVFSLLGVNLNVGQATVFVIAAVVGLLLTFILRFTAFGLAVRASVDSPTVTALHGTNTELVAAGTWMIGGALAGLSGVLLISFLGLDTASYQLAFIASFAAAVIARMRSMVWTFLAALAIGVIQETSTDYLPGGATWVGLRTCIPFLIMIVALVTYNFLGSDQGVANEAAAPIVLEPPIRTRGRFPQLQRAAPGGVCGAVLIALPFFLASFWLNLVSVGIALGVIFLSYTIIAGMGGMISLAQLSFAAIGALATAEFATFHHWPVLPSILLGGLVAVPVGAIVALPAMRWARLYLALGTLAFAFLVDNLIFTYPRYNNYGSGVQLSRPSIGSFSFEGTRGYYYLAIVAFGLVAIAVVRLRRSTAGLVFAAIRESERATVITGYGLFGPKLALFATSSFVAGVGGGLYATALQQVVPNTYTASIGIVLLAVIVTVGTRSVWAALVAGLMYSLLPAVFSFYLSASWQQVPAIMFGLGAIGLAREPRGFLVHASVSARRLRARLADHAAAREPVSDVPPPAAISSTPSGGHSERQTAVDSAAVQTARNTS